MTTELLRPGYSNISCTEDKCAFSSEMMSTELEVSIEKKDNVFFKRKLYLSTKGAFYTF